jgi:hypothetical protein
MTKPLKLLPCKKHGTKPIYREREYPPPFDHLNYALALTKGVIKEYYCAECELERDIEARNRIVKAWNDNNKGSK